MTSSSEHPGLRNESIHGSVSYMPWLDLLRFFAAFWVMLSHAGAAHGGGHAVTIFFVLSGFLIGGQLLSEKTSTNRIQIGVFYFKRATRIWLPYYLVTALYILIFVLRGQTSDPGFSSHLIGALTFTYNWTFALAGEVQPVWRSYHHIWSLCVEEQFYLVVPVMLLLIPRRLLVVCALLVFVALQITFDVYSGLCAGVILAALYQSELAGLAQRIGTVASGKFAVPVFLVVFALVFTSVQVFDQSNQNGLVMIGFAILPVALGSKMNVAEKFHGWTRNLGLMTYSYYLIHGLPVYFLGPVYRRVMVVDTNPLWFNIICGLLALPLSYFFVKLIELPVLRWRNAKLSSGSPLIRYAIGMIWFVTGVGIGYLIYLRLHAEVF